MTEHPLHQFHYCPRCGSTRFRDHNGKAKHCDDCGFTYYFNPSAATVALIVDDEGRWCVVRRAKDPARGTLDLPGGFSDCFESSEDGVRREVLEETGLHVGRVDFLFSIPNQYLYSDFLVHTIDMFYRCHLVKGEDATRAHASDDAAELLWLAPEEVRPEDFGLQSIRKGVERLLQQNY